MESESIDNLLRILGWERGMCLRKGRILTFFTLLHIWKIMFLRDTEDPILGSIWGIDSPWNEVVVQLLKLPLVLTW